MTVKAHSNYDDEVISQDLASSDLSVKEIAVKHKISASMVYQLARGDSRPKLKKRIDELIEAEKSAGIRLAKSRGRWFVARLVQIAGQDENQDTALKAVIKGLELAGVDVALSGSGEKQTINIVLTSDGNSDPVNRRLTGVSNGNRFGN